MNSEYVSPLMRQTRAAWAVKEWRKLPDRTKDALKPVLQVALESNRDMVHVNEVFKSAQNLPIFRACARWELGALTDIVGTLIRYASDEQLGELVP